MAIPVSNPIDPDTVDAAASIPRNVRIELAFAALKPSLVPAGEDGSNH